MKKKVKQFDFVAFMSPPPKNARGDHNINPEGNADFQTLEHYANVKACGFNTLCGVYEYSEEEYLHALELCDELGLEFAVHDQLCLREISKETDVEKVKALLKEHEEELISRFSKYAQHPSFVAIMGRDEPAETYFPMLRVMQDWVDEHFPQVYFEANLLPDYASGEQLTGVEGAAWDYQAHVDNFVDVVNPHFISYDYYALMVDRKTGNLWIRDTYLKNMEVVAKKAKEKDLLFSVYMLNLGHWSFRTPTTYAETGWQVFPAMAYGATGAQTFTYWTMLNAWEGNEANVTTALVSMDGKLLPAWYSMQQVISEVRAMEKEYLSLTWEKCVYISGEGKTLNPMFKPLEKNEDESLSGMISNEDIIVGLFHGEDKKGYVLANVTDPKDNLTATVTLPFVGEVTVYMGGEILSNEKKIQIPSGSGALVIVKN